MFANIIAWFIPFKKQLLIAAFVAVALGAVYMIAVANTKADIAEKAKTVTIKEIKAHGKIEREVIRLDDADLDSRLSKWMRD